MPKPHAIFVRLASDPFDGCFDVESLDVVASLRQLADLTAAVLRVRYSCALVSVRFDTSTTFGARYVVTDSEGSEVDDDTVDDVRETCGRVWESWSWAVSATEVR